MKQKNTLLTTTLIFFLSLSLNAQNVHIPDTSFKSHLVAMPSLNINGDSEIQVTEALNFTGAIDCSNKGITDLTGIEEFLNITELNCIQNQLTSLDVSSNTQLQILFCASNQLTSLDISNNVNLTSLDCGNNQLNALDVSNNIPLLYLYSYANPLYQLDVSSNINLRILVCGNNILDSIDVSHNIDLRNLTCQNNPLHNLDLSHNVNLRKLYCGSNQLTQLDLSNNTLLTTLNCTFNPLQTLDLSQNVNLNSFSCNANHSLTSVNVANGNNTNLSINLNNNANLLCVEVDDVAYSNANWLAAVDAHASFSTDCDCFIPTTIDTIISCDSYIWIDGNTYTTHNTTATDTLISHQGCDSIVLLNLTLNSSTITHDTITACDSYTWIDGNTYTTDNHTASDTLVSTTRCDSIIFLHLTIKHTNMRTDSVYTCANSYTWINGTTYTSDNDTSQLVLKNIYGCDSIIQLYLKIDTSFSIYTTVDTSIAKGEVYTIGSSSYSSQGTYVDTLLSHTGCDSIITTHLSIVLSNPNLLLTDLNIYPTPFTTDLYITSPNRVLTNHSLVITDILGKEVETNIQIEGHKMKIDGRNLEKGIYIIHMEGIGKFKVIKNH